MKGFYPQAQAKGKSDRPPGDAQSRAAHRRRHTWQPQIETARLIKWTVAELLSDPAQAALAAQQMSASKPEHSEHFTKG